MHYVVADEYIQEQRTYIIDIVQKMVSANVQLTPREKKILSRLQHAPDVPLPRASMRGRGRRKKVETAALKMPHPFIPIELNDVERSLPLVHHQHRISGKRGMLFVTSLSVRDAGDGRCGGC